MLAGDKLDLPVLAQTLVSPTKFFGQPNSDAKWVAAKNKAIATYQDTHPNGVTFTVGGTQITVTTNVARTNPPINAARNISRLFIGKQQRQAHKLAGSCSTVAQDLSQKKGISDNLQNSLQQLKQALAHAQSNTGLTETVGALRQALSEDGHGLHAKQARQCKSWLMHSLTIHNC